MTSKSNPPQEPSPVSAAASALAQLRWKGVSKAARKRSAQHAAAGRMVKMTAKDRSRVAQIAGSAITHEAAQARAAKAWETRRKNAAAKKTA